MLIPFGPFQKVVLALSTDSFEQSEGHGRLCRKRFESHDFQRCATPESQPAQALSKSKSAPALRLEFAKNLPTRIRIDTLYLRRAVVAQLAFASHLQRLIVPLRRLSSTPNLYVEEQKPTEGANNPTPRRMDCNTL